jgi:hypothetical protein
MVMIIKQLTWYNVDILQADDIFYLYSMNKFIQHHKSTKVPFEYLKDLIDKTPDYPAFWAFKTLDNKIVLISNQ